ncbi:MAG TPA: serine/threonine-protein kinase [Kofleriaceae bacterium]|nr:serine/threonine-protein kinase [Kofleriaceae bacterium]
MVPSSHQGAPIDRYVVLKYLAEGGMGAIYLGKKLGAGGFEKEVVLKQLLPEFTQQPEFIDLFLREARLSATLDHANIIHTIDLVTAGDEHFIVMEYLDGADLRTLLKKAKRRRARFSAAAGIYVAREVLSALAYAHSKIGPHGKPLRLIHRDVSPSNMLISRNGEVKLTDFGIAKASTHNSVFYRVKGKIGYMSPEQARNEPLDHRSDLYSLAVCVWEAITGERLFVHAGLTSSPDEIYGQPLELLSKKIPGLPAEVDKVMLRALAIDPNHRYQTAGEFQEALLRVAHRQGLMMSAPELSVHLREVCGPIEGWRELDRADSGGGGGGTEIYDEIDGTEQIDVSGADYASELLSVVIDDAKPALISDLPKRRARAQTSITNLSRLQGLELTSMINIAGDDHLGAKPLVDLDQMGDFDDDDLAEPPLPDGARQPGPMDPSELPAMVHDVLPILDELEDEDDEPQDTSDPFMPATEVVDEGDPRRSRWPLIIVAVIVLAGIGVAAAIGLSGPKLEAAPGQSSGQTPTSQ